MDFDNIDPEMFPEKDREVVKILLEMRKEMLEVLEKTRAKHNDPRQKTVGDRVQIWDASFAEVVEDSTTLHDILVKDVNRAKDYVETTCIVARDNQTYESELLGHKQTLDLIVWNSKIQKHIRTLSEFVKLV